MAEVSRVDPAIPGAPPPRAYLSPLFTWRSAVASKESMLTPTQRHVALTLSLHMSERGDSCFPSMARLTDETGLGLSTVREAMRRLHSLGWLHREVSHTRGRTNRYTALVPITYRQERAVSVTAETELPYRRDLAPKPPGVGGEDVIEGDKEGEGGAAGAARPRDLVWDSLEALFGPVGDGKSNARSKRNAAVRDLKGFGATAETIEAVARTWPRAMPEGALMTDVALATHYPQLAHQARIAPGGDGRAISAPCSSCGIGGGFHEQGCPEAVAA
jgi:hypothetical protein